MSTGALEDGTVYLTTVRDLDFTMDYYGFMGRTPHGRDEGTQTCSRRHHQYNERAFALRSQCVTAAAWRPGQPDQYHIPAWHTSRCGWPQSGSGA
jgi:hypothetical protein